jgi:hypothetical protein
MLYAIPLGIIMHEFSALRLHAYVRARTNSACIPIGAFAQDGCGDG